MKYEPNRQPSEISVGTACRVKQAEHDVIAQDIESFVRCGGSIEHIPRGVSGMQDGLYGYTKKHLNKKQKAHVAKLYDDSPDDETEE